MRRGNGVLEYNEHFENAFYGFETGFLVGGVISGFELAKVKMQTNHSLTFGSMFSPAFVRNNWKDFVHTVPAFATFFGGACAIEFSVNSVVGEKCGSSAGLCASAFSGAAFLTPADHLMFRKEKGVGYVESVRHFWGPNYRQVFTGFTPMVGREFLFGLSVLYTGPKLATYIQAQQKNNDNQLMRYWWSFVGIFMSALVTTTASQPLDTLTRKMQMTAYQSSYEYIPSFFDTVDANRDIRMLYRGFAPRLMLASVGAASIGTLFQFFKDNAHPKTIEESKNQTLRP